MLGLDVFCHLAAVYVHFLPSKGYGRGYYLFTWFLEGYYRSIRLMRSKTYMPSDTKNQPVAGLTGLRRMQL